MTIRIKDLIADARAQGCPARYELLGYSLVVSIVNGRPLVMQNGTRISQKDAQQFIDATYERRQRGYPVDLLEEFAERGISGSSKATVNDTIYRVHWFISQGFKYSVDDEPTTRDEFKRRIEASAFSERHPRKNHVMNTDISMEIERSLCVTPVASTVKIDAVLAVRYEAMAALIEHLLPALGVMTLCMEQLGDADTASRLRLLAKLSKNE